MTQTDFSTDTVAAYFEDSSDARKAVDALRKAGFTSAHLGIAHRGSYTGTSSTFGNTTVYETEDKEPSTWDKIKAWFTGNEAEVRAEEHTPGDAAQREIDPNVAKQSEEGFGDPSHLQGSFIAMNIPDARARYFAHRFRRGNDAAVVTVQADERAAEAESILAKYNADFGENAATYEYEEEDQENIDDDLDEGGRDDAPRNVQLLGVLRIQTVRVIPDDQALGRKDPARDLSGNRENVAAEGENKGERSA
ncbi:MAG: hypothetical protein WBQ95_11790 [Terracidiphilus sp.]